jgi:hypothetical protein
LRRFGDAQSVAALEKLEKAFKWEVRALYLVPIGMIIFFINATVASVFIGLGTLDIFFTDGFFSVVVTAAFLQPILSTLRQHERPDDQIAAPRSDACKHIVRTKWTTLAGVTLAVLSSSMLYINTILWAAMPDTFYPNPWLHPMVFMTNFDSVLNDLALLLVSGLLVSLQTRHNLYRIAPGSGPSGTSISNTINMALSQLESLPRSRTTLSRRKCKPVALF